MKTFADHYIKGVKVNVLCCELFLISGTVELEAIIITCLPCCTC